MATPLQVDAIDGERMCFWVHSEANPKRVYRVDLLSHGGIGECSCKSWQCRDWPVVRDGGRSACKHVTAARTTFLNDLLQHMAAKEAQQ